MTANQKKGFRYILFLLEGALLLGALVLLLLFPSPQQAESGSDLQGLQNTPAPPERSAASVREGAEGALIVLDASGIDDGGYFQELAGIINRESGQKGQYEKCEPEKLLERFAELAAQDKKPTVVMGPDNLVAQINDLADISDVYGQLYFNEAADRCVTKSTLPLALFMYAYYFRMDIMHDMHIYVPRSYLQLSDASAAIAAKNDQLAAFCFQPGTEGCQLMLQQMVRPKGSDVYDYISMLSEMRAKGYIIEDIQGGALLEALRSGSAVMAFGPGRIYTELLSDKDLLELIQVKPYLGNEPGYAASVLSCAVLSGQGVDAAQRYLVRLFREGIDGIIAKRNPHLVNPGMEYSLDSPWAGVLTDGGNLIILNDNMLYSEALMSAFGYQGDAAQTQ